MALQDDVVCITHSENTKNKKAKKILFSIDFIKADFIKHIFWIQI